MLIVLQLLIFNNIQFSGFVNPYVYVMFILILPMAIPTWILLLLSFMTGIVIDIFAGTMGVHAFATVMAGFVRPWVLSLNITAEASEPEMSPSSHSNGLRWFFIYTADRGVHTSFLPLLCRGLQLHELLSYLTAGVTQHNGNDILYYSF